MPTCKNVRTEERGSSVGFWFMQLGGEEHFSTFTSTRSLTGLAISGIKFGLWEELSYLLQYNLSLFIFFFNFHLMFSFP